MEAVLAALAERWGSPATGTKSHSHLHTSAQFRVSNRASVSPALGHRGPITSQQLRCWDMGSWGVLFIQTLAPRRSGSSCSPQF